MVFLNIILFLGAIADIVVCFLEIKDRLPKKS